MAISDGQKVDALNSNAAWISKTSDDATVGKLDLENPQPESGATVNNVQRELNAQNSYTGKPVNQPENTKPAWNDNSVGNSNDSLKERADALTTQVDTNRTNITENENDIADIRTTTGTSDGDVDMGTYTAGVNGFNVTDNESTKNNIQELIDGIDERILLSEKGAANGVAELDSSGLVPSSQLPSFVDDVLEFADFASFPVTGETGKIYVALDTNQTYRWSGSAYIEISPNDVNSVNGQTGTVVLDTDDISEGSTNLYYTDARADARIANASIDDLSDVDTSTTPPTDQQALIWNDTLSQWEPGDAGSGSGVGGINYIENFNAEIDTTGWSLYNDAATPPVDGTGGTASDITFGTTTSFILRGEQSFFLEKTTANDATGQGISYDFTIDNVDKNKPLYVSFDYAYNNFIVLNPGSFKVYMYDVTANEMELLKNGELLGLGAGQTASFKSIYYPSSNTDYRLIIHIDEPTTSTFGLFLDNVIVGPDKLIDFSSDGPVGELIPFAADSVPSNFLYCDGSAISRTTYSELFSVIGTTWGVGDGSTTFNLPDMRDDFLRGDGAGTVGDSQADATAVNGLSVNNDTHTHNLRYSRAETDFINDPLAGNNAIAGEQGQNNTFSSVHTQSDTHNHSLNGDSETRPRNKVIKWCIRYAKETSAVLSTTEMLNEVSKARFFRNSTQNVTSTSVTKVVFNDTTFNTNSSVFSLQPSGDVTVNKTGTFKVNFGIRITDFDSGTENILTVAKNSSTIVAKSVFINTRGDFNFSAIVQVNKGDTIQAFVNSASDTNYNITGASTVTYLEIYEIPDLSVYSVYGLTDSNEVELISTFSSPSATTWNDVPGLEFTLSPGEYDLFYNITAGMGNSTGSVINGESFLRIFNDTNSTPYNETVSYLRNNLQNNTTLTSTISNCKIGLVINEETVIKIQYRTDVAHTANTARQVLGSGFGSTFKYRKVK